MITLLLLLLAQLRLQQLNDQLYQTENRIAKVTSELDNLAQEQKAAHEDRKEKEVIRNKLAKKIEKVRKLKKEAEKIESEMKNTEKDIGQQEKDLFDIKGRLSRMSSRDSLYVCKMIKSHEIYLKITILLCLQNGLRKEMVDKQQQLEITSDEYEQLRNQLEQMLIMIARETAEIRRLEHELRDAWISQNEEIKEELNSVIEGLQNYLGNVKNERAKEHEERRELLRNREQLKKELQSVQDQVEKGTSAERILKRKVGQLQDQLSTTQRNLSEAVDKHRRQTSDASSQMQKQLEVERQAMRKEIESKEHEREQYGREMQHELESIRNQLNVH